jgi:gamma-glutamylcyclotransferase (GGCT)/AIG2-like uncharacterized protein YtfP
VSFLFVYGTLKRGFCRESFLAGQTYLGVVQTEPRYRMYNCGSYPGLREESPGLAIQGELWKVDAESLKRLDVEEGVDEGLYERRAIELSPTRAGVEAYFYLRSVSGMPDCGDCWE